MSAPVLRHEPALTTPPRERSGHRIRLRRRVDWPLLRIRLDSLVQTFDHRFLSTDPLERVLRFRSDEDREVGGLFAAVLAYGNVKQIVKSIDDLFARMDNRPAAFVRAFDRKSDSQRLRSFRHRWTSGDDLTDLCGLLSPALASHGSLGALFGECQRDHEPTVRQALARFVRALLDYAPDLPPKAGVRYLLTSPEDGSACKRMNLYLRWMIRGGDGIDCGLWPEISTSTLVIPLDTHVARIAGFLGLTRRKIPDWKMAEQVTASLRRLDPRDPVKYDFAISRLGIIDHCPSRRHRRKCAACPLLEICTA